jgi:hypothetical protein
MEIEKYEDQNVLEYRYSENGKPLFKIKYDLTLDINSIFQPERLNPEASKLVTYPIPEYVKYLFGRCDSPNSENK